MAYWHKDQSWLRSPELILCYQQGQELAIKNQQFSPKYMYWFGKPEIWKF